MTTNHPTDETGMRVGDKVRKLGGDYRFDGTVVSVFTKLSGQVRIVVEDDRGVLFIANTKNYEVIAPMPAVGAERAGEGGETGTDALVERCADVFQTAAYPDVGMTLDEFRESMDYGETMRGTAAVIGYLSARNSAALAAGREGQDVRGGEAAK